MRTTEIWIAVGLMVFMAVDCGAELRSTSFDSDPGWDGLNHRPISVPTRPVTQDFGYVSEGTNRGRIGGLMTPDGKPAYYAKRIETTSLAEPLSASGVIKVSKGAGNSLLGFFNAGTINEWRTPNTIVFRLNGRGDFFHVHIEYATSRWRAGATVIGRHDRVADRVDPVEMPSDAEYAWSIRYDPSANNGRGAIIATFDQYQATCPLEGGHKEDGATFNRFGLLTVVKHVDGGGRIFAGNIKINGKEENLSVDPHWEEFNNRQTYDSGDIRPRFDFGYSPTHYAGGLKAGEIGGLFFRGDCRYPRTLAYYGDRVGPLTLAKPLHAAGRVVLRRGVSDSTTLFGFFHSERSARVNESQKEGTPEYFLGLAIEGPSSEGFYAYPSYRVPEDRKGNGSGRQAPRIYPDGKSHRWSLDYTPGVSRGNGHILLALDGKEVSIEIPFAECDGNEMFNRLGFVTPWIDGNGQRVYLDDLEYTARQ